jgi:hypothetical protein
MLNYDVLSAFSKTLVDFWAKNTYLIDVLYVYSRFDENITRGGSGLIFLGSGYILWAQDFLGLKNLLNSRCDLSLDFLGSGCNLWAWAFLDFSI